MFNPTKLLRLPLRTVKYLNDTIYAKSPEMVEVREKSTMQKRRNELLMYRKLKVKAFTLYKAWRTANEAEKNAEKDVKRKHKPYA